MLMVASMEKPLPDSSDDWAFFLDIDGTLIDIAPTPDSITVPPDLPSVLERLCLQTGGALALMTGRSIEVVDRLFAPAQLPVAGIHGTEIRFDGGDISRIPPSPELAGIRQQLAGFVSSHKGTLLEDKGTAVAVHYRADPSLRNLVESEVRAAVATGGGDLVVQPGKMVFEIRPGHADKGHALARFMESKAFRGRCPLAIGDDVTDESMFRTAKEFGGIALRVGNAVVESAAPSIFADPAAVRAWLASLIRS
jgi:trehalose 6-phosphate phosphatase